IASTVEDTPPRPLRGHALQNLHYRGTRLIAGKRGQLTAVALFELPYPSWEGHQSGGIHGRCSVHSAFTRYTRCAQSLARNTQYHTNVATISAMRAITCCRRYLVRVSYSVV